MAQPASIDELIALYGTAGRARYGMEAIDQERHALQCGWLAQQAGATPAVIAASLLHDLGHLVHALPEADAPPRDLHHELLALPVLRRLFGPAVTEPVRLHVDAKRYLCATDPAYWAGLSPASQRSLALQGGPFTPAQAQAFIERPHAQDAVRLRRWDDQAKSPTAVTPGWDHFRPMLEAAASA